jgi:hypothetical protein
MARNATGTYSLVAGNPVVTGTTITSSWANVTLPDIATALTDSLSRSGKGGMLAALKGTLGSAALPAYSFTAYPDQGLYGASGVVTMAVAGVNQMRWQNGSVEVWDGSAWSAVGTQATLPIAGIVNDATTARTPTTADRNKIIRMSNASAITVTVDTEANQSWADNTVIYFRQVGLGAITFAEAVGVTVNGTLTTTGSDVTCALVKIGTDEWDVIGLD